MTTLTTSPAILSAEQIAAYESDGYLLVRGLFEASQTEALKEFFGELAQRRAELPPAKFILEEDVPPDAPALSHIRKINELHQHDEMLPFYGAEGPVAPLAAQLAGSNELLYSSSAFTKSAGHGSETPWHQDQALWSIWLRNAVSCWVALDKCTLENGCLQFVRGSHHDGFEPHVSTEATAHPHIPRERVPQERLQWMEMEPGDGVFFTSLMWHASDPNRSTARRIGMTAVYNSPSDQAHGENVIAWANNRSEGFGGAKPMPLRNWVKKPLHVAPHALNGSGTQPFQNRFERI